MNILFIDHDDSFSNNIVNFFRSKKCSIKLISSSDPFLLQKNFPFHEYKTFIFSPGPGSPSDYPQSVEFYNRLPAEKLVLGICLGHQIMLHATGGCIKQIAFKPIHGRQVTLNEKIVSRVLGKCTLSGSVVLYNSLGCHKNDLVFNSWDGHIIKNQICLMVEHKEKLHLGVQFHPESFASSAGNHFFKLFLRFMQRC